MSNNEQYVGKKVLVTVKGENGDAVEVEGTVDVGNDLGLVIKPKGKTRLDIIEQDDIIEIKYVADAPKPLAAKTLKVVEFGQARNHLLERHGYTLTDINKMDEQAAFDFHASLDHVALNLGHVHGAKEATPAAAAVAAEESAEA